MNIDPHRRWIAFGLLLICAVGAGCGGSDPPAGGNVLPSTCIAFQPMQAPAMMEVVAIQGSGSSCTSAVVELTLTGVNDVTTVAFQATYNAAVVNYLGHSLTGSQLTADGTTLLEVDNSTPGLVNLGLSRPAPATGTDFFGTETVVRLLFGKATNTAGSTSFDLTQAQVFDDGAPPTEIGGIVSRGGTLTIN